MPNPDNITIDPAATLPFTPQNSSASAGGTVSFTTSATTSVNTYTKNSNGQWVLTPVFQGKTSTVSVPQGTLPALTLDSSVQGMVGIGITSQSGVNGTINVGGTGGDD